jgi:hypothetical protein
LFLSATLSFSLACTALLPAREIFANAPENAGPVGYTRNRRRIRPAQKFSASIRLFPGLMPLSINPLSGVLYYYVLLDIAAQLQ